MRPLHFGSLFWPANNPSMPIYPSLNGRTDCQVAIVGGGMTGTIIGYVLARSGISTILIEQDRVASGSTSANTGLIQYSNDIMLSELAGQIGEPDAVMFYRACKNAVEKLCDVAEGLPQDVHFRRRSSLYYASTPNDVAPLRREYEMLHRHGFDAEWWDADRIASVFPFRREAAIVTQGDGEIDPYRFVSELARDGVQHGLRIHEHTTLKSVEGEKGGIVCRTERGEIHAERIVYAVGYSPESAGGRCVRALLNRSYVIVTKPLPSLAEWHQRWLLWETARPYLYLRTTTDGRMIAGGRDEPVRQPVQTDRELGNYTAQLMNDLRELFPTYDVELAYEWCATFGESADQLPWLGEDPDRSGQYYALGYGGNGTVYSQMAAQLLLDDILGIDNSIARIVSPGRTPSQQLPERTTAVTNG
ncbi:FAD-binding oxidoreductase [Cohnella sp. REN36]|uniref:NAD(P)/FAD-dependent oxidoreductase n=1 Tax=Cohnella sp. REN36 TaxID=2887347 RepID=UPI001D134D23|nr:FAD-binding oxidoreductase [Cohnella sp. REN36]MCC3375783.1 FAD-binding oxidoreductase [Cohnella sp. REN36]